MAIDPVTAAQQAAVEAQAAAQRAAEAAEASFIMGVTNKKELTAGCTPHEANRRASKFISLMGYDKWVALLQKP